MQANVQVIKPGLLFRKDKYQHHDTRINMENKELINKICQRRNNLADNIQLDKNEIALLVKYIKNLFFYDDEYKALNTLEKIKENLNKQLSKLNLDLNIGERFIDSLPTIQDLAFKDLEAVYHGDPSCLNYTEIIVSYTSYQSILAYRIANCLYHLNARIIARVIAEYAHETTGVDINPGATIGEYFSIDHGVGVVIGETAVVGHHVRIYHGVTLGVRSFKKDENGHLRKGGKRHPNIGNNVTIYANATILGGDTYIKNNSIIPTGALIMNTPEY